MKKVFLFAAFAVISTMTMAQVSVGLQAGANFGMGKLKINDAYFYSNVHSQKNKMKIGFMAGIVAKIPSQASSLSGLK